MYHSAMSRSSESSEISPSLTQSSISTTSSTSPPPRTPVRSGRAQLAVPRQPGAPHGDLLREAGYKETRVFTPESERVKHESPSPQHPIPIRQDRVGSVVNFFSGLIPGSTANSRPSSPNLDGPPTPTPPPRPFTPTRTSPLANRQRNSPNRQLYNHSPLNSSVESLTRAPSRTPKAAKQQRLQNKPPLPVNPMAPLHRPLPQHLRHSASIASLKRQQEKFAHQQTAPRHAPSHPRHMSAPHIARPRSTPPVMRPPENELLSPPASGLPPQMVLSKRCASAASVSETQVLCRSAPASRKQLACAQQQPAGLYCPSQGAVARGFGTSGASARAAAGQTHWRRPCGSTQSRSHGHAGRSPGALECEDAGEDHLSSSSAVSSEDEEGELNLARMLVPPKRQNSIRSLRRHLAPAPMSSPSMRSDRSMGELNNASPVPRQADQAVDLNDTAEEYLMFLQGSNGRRDTVSRKGLPRAWRGLLQSG
ncbi:hypothetical protein BD626DRAFT_504935 [Schizophyllum amplum]|uniref:Uncharacterized protein n=1 Tax=Schizophyllum amplum TaxID=97359 RepID=A0A550C689_9AGAR|nr:hypothetical protein BD626DRAFT_504935 [Auriculariopsis ampla]